MGMCVWEREREREGGGLDDREDGIELKRDGAESESERKSVRGSECECERGPPGRLTPLYGNFFYY